MMSSLSSLQRNMIKFLWAINMFVISWKIYLINFFYIFFIFFLSAIFIIIFRLLQSNDNSFLTCYFLIVTSSFVTFTHDMIFNEKHILSYVYMLFYVCSCLLSSYTNVFSFYTFFAMNAFWFSLFFSSESFQRCCISFTATFFHEWSLLFSFFNVDVYIRKSIMLVTYFSSLCKLFCLAFRLIASSQVIEIESSSRLVKTRFESEFLTWVFELNQDVRLKYLSRVRELKSSIDSKFSIRLVKTWR